MTTLRQLYRGELGPSSLEIVRWVEVTLTTSLVVSNLIGATAIFAVISWVIPLPRLHHSLEVRIANLAALGIYAAVAAIAGTVWGKKRFSAGWSWLIDDREPTEEEKRELIAAPLRLVTIPAAFWVAGIALFTVLNSFFSWELARVVASAVALGAVTTCAIAYLVSERFLRPAAALALSHGKPDSPALPGTASRALLGWALGTAIPLLGLILVAFTSLTGIPASKEQLSVTILVLGGLAVAIGFLVTLLIARSVSDPISSLRHALRCVEDGDLECEVPVYDGSVIGDLQAGFNQMIAGLREREKIRDLFGRHVGEEVARAAMDGEIVLGGELREVVVLFADIVGSTALTASREPQDVVNLINRFLDIFVRHIDQSGGWVNKFEGDAALAVFGAPLRVSDACGRALRAARRMSVELRARVTDCPVAIGAATGIAVAGHVGNVNRFEYTVIGDPVNEAARLTELAKTTPGHILVSQRVVDGSNPEEASRWVLGEEVVLRGRSEPTRVAMPSQSGFPPGQTGGTDPPGTSLPRPTGTSGL